MGISDVRGGCELRDEEMMLVLEYSVYRGAVVRVAGSDFKGFSVVRTCKNPVKNRSWTREHCRPS